jgi:hypothetical protein
MTRIHQSSIADQANKDPLLDRWRRAQHRLAEGRKIGEAYRQAAVESSDPEARAVSVLILQESQPENLFVARDLHNRETGEAFDGHGTLVLAGTRLTPGSIKQVAAKARKRAQTALGRVRPQSGDQLMFVTLTAPRLFGFDSVRTVRLFDAALVLLKKRKFFKGNVRGAIIGCEFTTGAYDTHFHYHAHMLGWMKDGLRWKKNGVHEFRVHWTDCLVKAARKLGEGEIQMNTRDGYAVAQVKKVVPKQRGKETITREAAIAETCKYTCKGSDLAKIPHDRLVAFERLLYRRRLIETFGECNAQRGRTMKKPYVLEKGITDGEPKPKIRRTRKESLRKIGAKMIGEGKEKEFAELVGREFTKRRIWRKKQLMDQYPAATFIALNGQVFSAEKDLRIFDRKFLQKLSDGKIVYGKF